MLIREKHQNKIIYISYKIMSGFYVNGTNINTLFKPGNNTLSTSGGFKIGGQAINYTTKATQKKHQLLFKHILEYLILI